MLMRLKKYMQGEIGDNMGTYSERTIDSSNTEAYSERTMDSSNTEAWKESTMRGTEGGLWESVMSTMYHQTATPHDDKLLMAIIEQIQGGASYLTVDLLVVDYVKACIKQLELDSLDPKFPLWWVVIRDRAFSTINKYLEAQRVTKEF